MEYSPTWKDLINFNCPALLNLQAYNCSWIKWPFLRFFLAAAKWLPYWWLSSRKMLYFDLNYKRGKDFLELKKKSTLAPLLQYLDLQKLIQLETDASNKLEELCSELWHQTGTSLWLICQGCFKSQSKISLYIKRNCLQ